jgi:S1-C subfamily serine protease
MGDNVWQDPPETSAFPTLAGGSSMFVHFSCPHCGKKCKAPVAAAGKRGKCSGCGGAVHIPGSQAPQASDVPRSAGEVMHVVQPIASAHIRPGPARPARIPEAHVVLARRARPRATSHWKWIIPVAGGVFALMVALVVVLIIASGTGGSADAPPIAAAPQDPGVPGLPPAPPAWLADRQPAIPPAANGQPLTPDVLFARTSPAVMQVIIHDQRDRTLGGGSGFLIGNAGLIATNYHVIRGAHKVQVVLADKTKLPVAGLAASEKNVDLAILKVAGQIPAQPLELAGAELPRVGTKVYAIGNPLGFSNTLSDGLVSGHRELRGFQLIQTSAPISPGSSGGPLLDPTGKVVGVTTLQFNGGQNLNFAVPATQVARLLAQYDGNSPPKQFPIPGEQFAGPLPHLDPSKGPDLTLKPTFGAVALRAGFVPDPYVKTLVAGGPLHTSLGGVPAWVAQPPDFQLFYTANDVFPLTINVQCAEPTTLLVNLPDGTWIADAGAAGSPSLRFATPRTGRYDIWVGTRNEGALPTATLRFTEK